MSAITTKSTKAEILAAYKQLSAAYAKDRAEAVVPMITLEATMNTLRFVGRELINLVNDVYSLGAFCRKASQPLLDRAILIVKN